MSTIRADDVGPSAGGTTRALVRGTAAAWVNFNGTGTVAVRDSENVSSLTDNSTGSYTINFTNTMSSSNYSLTVQVGGSGARNWVNSPFGNRAASYVDMFTYNTSGVSTDYESNNNAIHGDLA